MTEETKAPAPPADKLVKVYVKMRDAKAKLKADFDARNEEIDTQMAAIESELLNICKSTGQDGGKTVNGSFTRTVKTRYWTSDWESMTKFIKEHDAIQLLEQRVAQNNMKAFLLEHPELMPAGLNVDSRYAITVRRPTA